MTDTLITAIRVGLSCIVFAFFVFSSLKSRLRYGVLKTCLLIFSLILITIAVTVLFFTSGAYLVNHSTWGIAIWFLLAIFIFHLTIKGSYLEILFIVLVVLNLYVNITAIVKTILHSMGGRTLTDMRCIPIMLGVLILYIPLLYLLMFKLYKPVVEFNITRSFWNYIWLIPTMTYMIFFVKIINEYWRRPIDLGSESFVFIILWSFCSYLFFGVTLEMLIQAYRGIVAVEQMKLVTLQLQMQEGQHQRLLNQIEKTSIIRHDWRHHLLSISGYAEKADMDGLKAYLKTLNLEYATDYEAVICENHVVNTILKHHAAIARSEGITINTRVNIPEAVGVADLDLCIIFGNLVENAVEACRSPKIQSKFIAIKADVRGNQIIAVVKNTYDGYLKEHEGVLDSTKHSGSGIGIPSVRKIVKKYNGSFRIEHNQKYFNAFVLLSIGTEQRNQIEKARL